MTGCIDASPSQLLSFLVRQVPSIALVENTVCECTSRADGEKIAFETSPVRVYVEDGRALGTAGTISE